MQGVGTNGIGNATVETVKTMIDHNELNRIFESIRMEADMGKGRTAVQRRKRKRVSMTKMSVRLTAKRQRAIEYKLGIGAERDISQSHSHKARPSASHPTESRMQDISHVHEIHRVA